MITDGDSQEELILPESDRELLRQCTVTTFRSTGKGGQYVNKTDSAVRLRHTATGITVLARRERSQYLNKKNALERLRKKLQQLSEHPEERKPTVIPYREKVRRRTNKKILSGKKSLRKTPAIDD
jgi:protein subunit release factor B